MDKYGEKYSGDSKFVADCRQLQSIYRVEVNETIRPYKGRDGKTHYYGNYISDGEKSGNNFLTNCAFRYATERVTNKKNRLRTPAQLPRETLVLRHLNCQNASIMLHLNCRRMLYVIFLKNVA